MADKNFKSFADIPFLGDIVINEVLKPDMSFQDTLKFSHVRNGCISVPETHGGTEDCVDVNRGCFNLVIIPGLCFVRGKYLATIKGGSSRITLQALIKQRRVIVEYGNWSDNGNGTCRSNILEVHSLYGSRSTVIVRCGYAEWPDMRGNVTFKKDYLGSAAIKAYCFFKGLFCKSTPPKD